MNATRADVDRDAAARPRPLPASPPAFRPSASSSCTCCASVEPRHPGAVSRHRAPLRRDLRLPGRARRALGTEPGDASRRGAGAGPVADSTDGLLRAAQSRSAVRARSRGYDIWFTGLRREQSPSRAPLGEVEPFTLPTVRCCGRSARSPAWTTQGRVELREGARRFRCCRSTPAATRASAASRARRCRSIRRTSDRADGAARSSSAGFISRRVEP